MLFRLVLIVLKVILVNSSCDIMHYFITLCTIRLLQAVQYVQEILVSKGQTLVITAQHDTYSISFSHQTSQSDPSCSADDPPAVHTNTVAAGDAGSNHDICEPWFTGVPLFDPIWNRRHQQLSSLNGALAQKMVQNPLEYRRLCLAASAVMDGPHNTAAHEIQAAAVLARFMS